MQSDRLQVQAQRLQSQSPTLEMPVLNVSSDILDHEEVRWQRKTAVADVSAHCLFLWKMRSTARANVF